MIKGKSVTKIRQNVIDCRIPYRKIDALNKSSIACFDSDPVKFYNEFILKKKRKESVKKSVSLILGDLVDFYLLECSGSDIEFENRFDEQFSLFQGVKGTAQIFKLVESLYDITQNYLNNVGEIVVSFEDRFKEAFQEVKDKDLFKGKTVDQALEEFDKKGKEYFQLLLDNSCKTVVEVSLVDKSRRISEILRTDDFTRHLFLVDNVEMYRKYPIEWDYTCQSGKVIKCKSEIDIIRIDHEKKVVSIHDLKTNFDNEDFQFSYFKYRYDLQAAFYYLATQSWMKEGGLEDYKLVPMEFVVGDTSANNRRPLRYRTNNIDLDAGLNGCNIRGRYYKGIHELIEAISWAEDNNIWTISKENFQNDGICNLGIVYE